MMGFLGDLGRTNTLVQQTQAISNLALNIRQGQRQDQEYEEGKALRDINLRKAKFELDQATKKDKEDNEYLSLDVLLKGVSPPVREHYEQLGRRMGWVEDIASGPSIKRKYRNEAFQYLQTPEGIKEQIIGETKHVGYLDEQLKKIDDALKASDILFPEKSGKGKISPKDQQELVARKDQLLKEKEAVANSIELLKGAEKHQNQTRENYYVDQVKAGKMTKDEMNAALAKEKQEEKPLDYGDLREAKTREYMADKYGKSNVRFADIQEAGDLKAINKLVQEELDIRAEKSSYGRETGRREADLNQPIDIGEVSNYFDPNTLQPIKKGTTKQQALDMGAVKLSNEEIKFVGSMQKARAEFEQIAKQAEGLITATDTASGLQQGASLWAQSFLPNTKAKLYKDTKEGYLGLLSKAYAGETGVLTNPDISRISKSMPGFSDTKATAKAKFAIMRTIAKTAEKGALGKISGLGWNEEAFRNDIEPMISALEEIDSSVQNKTEAPKQQSLPKLDSRTFFDDVGLEQLDQNERKSLFPKIKAFASGKLDRQSMISAFQELTGDWGMASQWADYFEQYKGK